MTQMQGIVSILRSDNIEKTTKATSLRRTLSADMSSNRWLGDNGMPLMKKIASSEHIAIDSSSSSCESDEDECEVIGKGDQNPSRMDIWTAIMSQKKEDGSGKLPPPYVHPLVKKKANSLSEKSLKVCTESLGSETGSEVFSLPPVSNNYNNQPKDQSESQQKGKKEERASSDNIVKVACNLTTKKSQQARSCSFPPPIQSLAAARADGPSVHMHSRRVDGRLVVEAVTVQQQKYFEAQREDGRFLLTLINDPKEPPSGEDREIETYVGGKDIGILNYRPAKSITPGQKSPVRMKRMLEKNNENPWWKLNNNTKEEKMMKVEVVEVAITQSAAGPLVPRGRMAGLPPLPPASVNPYEYFWRAKPTVASVTDPDMMSQHRPPTKTKELVLLRGNKADCFLPSLKGCKEPRRSVLMWEPFCIATS